MTDNTQTQNETQTEATAEATTEAPKRAKQIIFQDAEGNEIGRRDKGRGRNPKNAEILPNGDILVKGATLNDAGDPELPKVAVVREAVLKIDLDAEGNVVNKVAKGKGRAPKGYTKMEDGPHAGNWVKQHAAESEAEQTAEVAAEDANEPVEAVETVEADAETVAATADADAEQWVEA